MPVDNNQHQRIDDVSTYHISYSIATHELFDCIVKASRWPYLLVIN